MNINIVLLLTSTVTATVSSNIVDLAVLSPDEGNVFE